MKLDIQKIVTKKRIGMGLELYNTPLYNQYQKVHSVLTSAPENIVKGEKLIMQTLHQRDAVLTQLLEARMEVTGGKEEAHKLLEESVDTAIDLLYKLTKPSDLTKETLQPVYDAIHTALKIANEDLYILGYFRDPYAGEGLMNRMGFRWWVDLALLLQDDKEVYPLRILPPSNVKKLLDMVQAREFLTIQEFAKSQAFIIRSGDPERWDALHTRRKAELIKILQTAVDMNEPLVCLT